jgi:hypothetical protein
MDEKIFEIFFNQEEDSCTAQFVTEDFPFTEETVAGVIATVAYTFLTSVENRDREQFMARLSELVSQEFRTGDLESRMDVQEL